MFWYYRLKSPRRVLNSGILPGQVCSMIWKENMAAGTNLSHPVTILEGDYEDVSAAEDESLDGLKQLTSGKPPRHMVQRCMISARLLPATDSVS